METEIMSQKITTEDVSYGDGNGNFVYYKIFHTVSH